MNIVVKRDGALGDVIEVTAITRRLREENPEAHICVETHYPWIFRDNSDVDWAPEKYDRIIDLNGAFEKFLRKLHPIDAYSEVAFGDQKTEHKIYFKSEPLPANLTGILARMPYIALHPATSWPIRTLPRQFWQDVVNQLTLYGYRVVVTGTDRDQALHNVIDLRGRLNLAQQARLIKEAECFVCSESGPMILAQTTQTPVVALLTMIVPEHVKHEGCGYFTAVRAAVPCVGCALEQPAETTYFDCKLGTRACLEAFDVHQVVQAIREYV